MSRFPARDNLGRFTRPPALLTYREKLALAELAGWLLIFTMVCIALTVLIYRQVSILDERHSAAVTDERSTAKAVAMTPVMVDGALPVKSAEARPHLVCKGDSASLAETPSTAGENPASFTNLSSSVEKNLCLKNNALSAEFASSLSHSTRREDGDAHARCLVPHPLQLQHADRSEETATQIGKEESHTVTTLASEGTKNVIQSEQKPIDSSEMLSGEDRSSGFRAQSAGESIPKPIMKITSDLSKLSGSAQHITTIGIGRYSGNQAPPAQFIYQPGHAYANPVDEYEYETRGITP